MTSDEAVRSFVVEAMADAIWREGIEHLPLGASDRLARAAYDAIPAELRARLEDPPEEP